MGGCGGGELAGWALFGCCGGPPSPSLSLLLRSSSLLLPLLHTPRSCSAAAPASALAPEVALTRAPHLRLAAAALNSRAESCCLMCVAAPCRACCVFGTVQAERRGRVTAACCCSISVVLAAAWVKPSWGKSAAAAQSPLKESLPLVYSLILSEGLMSVSSQASRSTGKRKEVRRKCCAGGDGAASIARSMLAACGCRSLSCS